MTTIAQKLLAVFGAGELTAIHNAKGVSFAKGGTKLDFAAKDEALTADLKKEPGTYTVSLSEEGGLEQTLVEPPKAEPETAKAPAKTKQSADFGFGTRQAR